MLQFTTQLLTKSASMDKKHKQLDNLFRLSKALYLEVKRKMSTLINPYFTGKLQQGQKVKVEPGSRLLIRFKSQE